MHGDKGLIADGLAYMAIRYFSLYLTEQIVVERAPRACGSTGKHFC